MAETIRKVLTSWYFNKSNKYEVHFGTWCGQQWTELFVSPSPNQTHMLKF